jgi:hypothetical protein
MQSIKLAGIGDYVADASGLLLQVGNFMDRIKRSGFF